MIQTYSDSKSDFVYSPQKTRYRHITGEAWKQDKHYSNIPLPMKSGHGQYLKSSGKFCAFLGVKGQNRMFIQKLNETGKMANNPGYISLDVIKRSIWDFDFSPFRDNLIAMGTGGGNVPIVKFSKNGIENGATINKYTSILSNIHTDKACYVKFHPSAASIIASASYDNTVKVSNITKESVFSTVGELDNYPLSLQWNTDGSMLAVTSKDKMLRVFDPRNTKTASGQSNIVTIQAFDSTSPSKCFWIWKMNLVGATGFDKHGKRQLKLWDVRNTSEPALFKTMEQSAAVLMPHFDEGNSVLYLWEKGGPSIQYGEIWNDSTLYYPLGHYRHDDSIKGGSFIPKRALKVMNREIERFLNLSNNAIVPISFYLRRGKKGKNNKNKEFDSEVFPNAPADRAAMTADEYLSGLNKNPTMMSLNPRDRNKLTQINEILRKNDAKLKKIPNYGTTSTNDKIIYLLLQCIENLGDAVDEGKEKEKGKILRQFEDILKALVKVYELEVSLELQETEERELTKSKSKNSKNKSKKGKNKNKQTEINTKVIFGSNGSEPLLTRIMDEIISVSADIEVWEDVACETVKILLKKEYRQMYDINEQDSLGRTCLFFLVGTQWTSLVSLLLDHGADPNIKSTQLGTTLTHAIDAAHENDTRKVIEMLYLLLNLPKGRKNSLILMSETQESQDIQDSNEKKNDENNDDCDNKNSEDIAATERIGFDWEGLINDCSSSQGRNAFHICCDVSIIDILKILLYYDKKYGNNSLKIDMKDAGKDKNNGLMIACAKGYPKFVEYLLTNYNWDINQQNSNGETALHFAARKAHPDCIASVSYLLNYDKMDCNVYLTFGDEKQTPLQTSIDCKNPKVTEMLINFEQKIENVEIESSKDFAYYGDLSLLREQMYRLIKVKHKVETWDDLVKHNLLNEDIINQCIQLARKRRNETIAGFLISVQEKALNNKSLNVLYSMITPSATSDLDLKVNGGDNGSNKNNSKKNDATANATRLANKTAHYIFERCDKHTLTQLSQVINNGILKHECGFDDSLLFLSKLVDSETLVNTLEKCTADCLNSENKNSKKYLYFKSNLLNSKIWGDVDINTGNGATDEAKESNSASSSSGSNKCIFERIESNVIKKELDAQRKYIKKSIIEEEKQWGEYWKTLKEETFISKGSAQEQGQAVKQLLKSDFAANELPFDNVNGFDGASEYDQNGYLTKLLIATHQIDPIFQQDAKYVFTQSEEFENSKIECKFTSAPPKTKERCQRKAELDYYDQEWPTTKSIIDLVRCSVVFKTSKDLVNAIKIFKKMVSNNKCKSIREIKRVKNGFNIFNSLDCNGDSDTNLSSFMYRDVKFNVLIQYKQSAIVGEVQMMLEFMLQAKKIGHSVYSFVRNEDYYKEVSSYLTSKLDTNTLYPVIISRNMTLFANMLLNCNSYDKDEFFIKEKDQIVVFLKEANWKKGLKLFNLYINSWS